MKQITLVFLKKLGLYVSIFVGGACLLPSVSAASEQEAIRKTTQALIIQTGVDDMVKNYVANKFPEKYRKPVDEILKVVWMIENKKVEFKWSF